MIARSAHEHAAASHKYGSGEKYSEYKWNNDVNIIILYISLRRAAQHCFAADAAGAAPDLGAIFERRGVPALVPVGGGRQRRR